MSMMIAWETATFTVAFEAGGIAFYSISENEADVDEIKNYFSCISVDEEKKLISMLTDMFYTKKPCGAIWRLTVAGREMMFYLNGYQIEVTTA